MKLSEYIEGLQECLKEYGDLDCYYAIDDEGNGYQQVNYSGNRYYRSQEDEVYRPELYSEEDLQEEYEEEWIAEYFLPVIVVN